MQLLVSVWTNKWITEAAFQQVLSHASSGFIWCFLNIFHDTLSSTSLLHINFHNHLHTLFIYFFLRDTGFFLIRLRPGCFSWNFHPEKILSTNLFKNTCSALYTTRQKPEQIPMRIPHKNHLLKIVLKEICLD